MNNVSQLGFEFHQLSRRELAFEDAELEMVSPITHGFEDFTKSLIVGDIVRDNIRMAHD
jgi:hypothetical protein